MSDEVLACQQPFNTLPKFPTDAEQDLRPNFNLAVGLSSRNFFDLAPLSGKMLAFLRGIFLPQRDPKPQ
jgi:hypothetical protein